MASKSLILRSLIICLVLLFIYDLSIRVFFSHLPVQSENQWSTNVITVQDLAARPTTPHTILIGSSLSARMDLGSLNDEVFSLTLAGKSTLDGLQILERTGHIPNLVLLETNVLTVLSDTTFIDQMFWEPMHTLRQYLPVLSERYRPLNNLRILLLSPIAILMDIPGSAFTFWRKALGNNDRETRPKVTDYGTPVSRNNSIFSESVNWEVKKYSVVPTKEVTQEAISQLREFVDILRSRGSAVVLFEMPMHPDVCAAAGVVHIRRAVRLSLPSETYLQLPSPECNNYKTTDGLHLSVEEAQRFTEFLYQELKLRGLHIGDDEHLTGLP